MRNMSFMLTERQVREGTKTVTRRLGWWFLKPGDRLMACVKCQGLGKGGKIQKIREIEVVSVRRTELDEHAPFASGNEEARLEGFPSMCWADFVTMFCNHMKCHRRKVVNRIEYKYVMKP